MTIDKRTNKGEVNADWIQKEKLTVLKTKEDRKNSEKNESVQNKPKKVAPIIEPIDQAVFGFGTKKPNEGKSEWRDNEKGRKAHGKVVLNDSDFPALV